VTSVQQMPRASDERQRTKLINAEAGVNDPVL
jgi:hypothetical protein